MPTERTSAQELERGLGVLAQRQDRVALYRRIAAQAGLTGVRPPAACLLTRIAAQPDITLADLAEEIGTSTANLAPSLDQLANHRLVATDPRGGAITLTEHGRSAIERLRAARENDLRELLDGWPPEQEPELDQRLRSLARDCMNADAARLRRDERLRSAA
jgi:DNA-binding MarR family transcriptional regulator